MVDFGSEKFAAIELKMPAVPAWPGASDAEIRHFAELFSIANASPGQLVFTPEGGKPVNLGAFALSENGGEFELKGALSAEALEYAESMAEIRARLGAGETITQIYASWGISGRTRLNALD